MWITAPVETGNVVMGQENEGVALIKGGEHQKGVVRPRTIVLRDLISAHVNMVYDNMEVIDKKRKATHVKGRMSKKSKPALPTGLLPGWRKNIPKTVDEDGPAQAGENEPEGEITEEVVDTEMESATDPDEEETLKIKELEQAMVTARTARAAAYHDLFNDAPEDSDTESRLADDTLNSPSHNLVEIIDVNSESESKADEPAMDGVSEPVANLDLEDVADTAGRVSLAKKSLTAIWAHTTPSQRTPAHMVPSTARAAPSSTPTAPLSAHAVPSAIRVAPSSTHATPSSTPTAPSSARIVPSAAARAAPSSTRAAPSSMLRSEIASLTFVIR
ncbi:hypothetical protein EW146_g6814 [Bondarzewia mesenterica]|uniref:Uncharacterized protein n=1 Tax=Bondarzewia mesenterica TaxID=1095465 RepID=A0A4S4LPG2_9AGAM|nr:hypothetical protein EW146_g6814 [Bondarzewia mesenterica]